MRRLNVKLFVFLLCALVLTTAATVAVHRLQASNIAEALLYQADQAEKEGRGDQAARYLGRYLEFAPHDLDQRARLGAILADPKLLATPKGQRRARFVLEQVLARAPEHHGSRALLVRVALESRLDDLAAEHLAYLDRTQPDLAEAAELRAQWHELKGNDVAALESYRRAVALLPERIENNLRLVRLLRRMEAGRPRAHAAELDRLLAEAVKRAPEHPGVMLAAAERAMDQEDAAAARKQLLHGLEKNPRDPRFYLALARVEEKDGKPEQALAAVERGLAAVVKERHFELLWAQANLCLDLGRVARARATIDALRALPRTETAQLFLQARVQMQQGLWFEASRALERLEPALKSSPELALQSALYLGVCYEQLNEPARQLAAYRKAVEIDPASTAGRRGIAMAQWALGSVEGAIEALREHAAIAKDGRDAADRRLELARMLLLANLKKESKNWEGVERELDAAQKADPDRLDAILLRAEMHFHRDRKRDAHGLLEAARGRHGKRAELWLTQAMFLERENRVAEAVALLGDAPDAVDVRLTRARLWSKDADNLPQLKALEEGLERFDSDERARLLHGLGMTYFQMNQPRQAERLWWAITLLPRHAVNTRIRLLLLDLAVQQNDEMAIDRVLGDLEKLDPAGKESTLCRFGYAVKHLWQARHGKKEMAHAAKKLLLAVEAERPSWDAAALARAEADELLGQFDQAISNYRKAMELGQRSADVTRKLVFLLTQTQRFDEAEKEIGRLQKEAPLTDALNRLAVEISVQRDDYSKAEKLIRGALSGKAGDWRDHLWLGQVLAADGRAAEAEKELRTALTMDDTRAETYVALVRLLARAGQADRAQTEMDALKARVPVSDRHLALAHCHEILGQVELAEAAFTHALKDHAGNLRLRKTYASFLMRSGKAAHAEPLLRELAKGDSAEDAAWARRTLAIVLVARGDAGLTREALEAVGVRLGDGGVLLEEKATEQPEELLARAKVLALQHPRTLRSRAIALLEGLQSKNLLSAEDQFLLAQLYVNQGPEPAWWGKARDLLLGLVKSYPRHPHYLLFFAQQSLLHKDTAEADRLTGKLEQVEKARGLAKGELGTIELRARLLEASGQGARALALLEEYAGRVDAPPERVFMVASLHGRLGDLRRAVEVCMASKASLEGQARALTGILRRYQQSGHFAKGKSLWHEQADVVDRMLKEAAAAHPDKLALRLHLADLYDMLGRYDDVERLCREVLERDPDHRAALNNLAWLLAQRKTHAEEALRLIDRAIARHGPRPDLLDTRAVAYLNLGRAEPAILDLMRATREAPSAAKFFNLARAYHLTRNTKAAAEALNQATTLGLDDQMLHPTERDAYRQVVAEVKGR